MSAATTPLLLWSGRADWLQAEPWVRWGLVALALAWALVARHGHAGRTLLMGMLFTTAAVGYWSAVLGRPYGLLEHDGVTREAAAAVLREARGALDGITPGTPFAGGAWARLADVGVPAAWLVNLPTLLPVAVLPLAALLVHTLWRAPAAPLAALLWLAFSSGDLDGLRGLAFVPGLWARPAASLGVLVTLAALLAGENTRGPWTRFGFGAAALGGAALALAGDGPALGMVPGLLALALDPWPWWLLALPSWRAAGGAPRVLVVSGAALLAAAAAGAPLDAWAAHALLRLGLVLLAARTLESAAPALGAGLQAALARVPGLRTRAHGEARGLALAALVALGVPGSFLTWWQPLELDPTTHASLAPPPDGLIEVMQWVRAHTSPDAVFVSAPTWSAAVPVLGARRVLRAPSLVASPDDARRVRLTYLALAGRGAQGRHQARHYGVTHLLVAPGDLARAGLDPTRGPAAAERWRLRYAGRGGFRVYELIQWNAAEPPASMG